MHALRSPYVDQLIRILKANSTDMERYCRMYLDKVLLVQKMMTDEIMRGMQVKVPESALAVHSFSVSVTGRVICPEISITRRI